MATSIAYLVAEHLAIWNSPASHGRARSIASIYCSDVLVAEPDAVHHGHDGVAKAIDALPAIPGTQLELSGDIQTAQALSTYSWTVGPAGGPPMITGRDVISVHDGVIESVHVFIDAHQT